MCDPPLHQTERNRAIASRVPADVRIIPFHPAVPHGYLPDLLSRRHLDPVAGQRDQPLHHQAPVLRRRPEDDDVAAGQSVAGVEAEPAHQRAVTLLGLQGGVHGGATHGDDGGVPVVDGDEDEGSGDAVPQERPEEGPWPCHGRGGGGGVGRVPTSPMMAPPPSILRRRRRRRRGGSEWRACGGAFWRIFLSLLPLCH